MMVCRSLGAGGALPRLYLLAPGMVSFRASRALYSQRAASLYAVLMELADMQGLGSCAVRREGSSPSCSTTYPMALVGVTMLRNSSLCSGLIDRCGCYNGRILNRCRPVKVSHQADTVKSARTGVLLSKQSVKNKRSARQSFLEVLSALLPSLSGAFFNVKF